MSPLLISMSVIVLIGASSSLFLNACIILESGKSLSNGVKTNQVDLLHLVMGITNILMSCVFTVHNIFFWFPNFFSSDVYLVVIFPFMFFVRFSYWLMAWLCACYCTGITRFSHRVFVSMKKVCSDFLPHLLFLTGIGSLALVLFHYRRVMIDYSYLTKDTFNSTVNKMDTLYTVSKIFSISVDYFFPLTVIVTSLMVTMSSLLTHIWKINKAGSGVRQSIQAHVNAVRTMMLLLLLSIIFFISTVVSILVNYSSEYLVSVISWTMVAIFPTAEGVILIQASPKLKNKFLTWLSAGRLVGCGD